MPSAQTKIMIIVRPAIRFLTGILLHQQAEAVPVAANFGSASSFARFAGPGNAVAGPNNSTAISTASGTLLGASSVGAGLRDGILIGMNHAWKPVTQNPQMAPGTAYVGAVGPSAAVVADATQAQGGTMLPVRIDGGSGSIGINGVLPPNTMGAPNEVGGIPFGPTAITTPGSGGPVVDGAQAGPVVWTIGSAAALGTESSVQAAVRTFTSNTYTTGTIVDGWVPYGDHAVALGGNGIVPTVFVAAIEVADTGSTLLLLVFGLGATVAFGFKPGKNARSAGRLSKNPIAVS